MARLDILGIKSEIKTLLDNHNTETAEPNDLSYLLPDRVQDIFTYNVNVFDIQASQLPAVAIWVEGKRIEQKDIGPGQLNTKRWGRVDVKIAGIVYNSTIPDQTGDEAEDDCVNLMENIENILRKDPQLNNSANWHLAQDVEYFPVSLNEETHYRVGILTLEVTRLY